MNCTIEVSGQEQKRFDFLSKKFGNRAALQALLDADPNVEIDGFISDVEIGNRVNALAFSVVNNLIQDAAGVTDSTPTALDLRPENLEPLPLDRAIRKSKNDLEIILDEALTDQSTEENKNKATRAYVALQNFESLIPKIKERIEVYGLKLSELNNDLEAAYNDETNENTVKQHIYNMTHFEKSRLDSMSPSVKLFLATLPQKRFGENNQIEDVVDDLGMPVPVDFHFLHSTLSKNLADIHNFDEMMGVMESLGEEIPNIADIYEFMNTEEVEGKQIVINTRGEKVNNFKSAFYTSFVNTYNNFMTVTTQEYTDPDGVKQRRVAVIPTNKRKFHKVLTQRWANEGARILNTPESARKKAWDTKLKTIFYPYSNESRNKVAVARKARLDKLNRANNKVVLEEVSHALEFLGINVSSQALSQLKKEMNGKEKGSFGKYVDETIGKMAESMWIEGNNIFKDESGNIAKLARIEAKISKDLAVESFMNGEGNQVHPINLPTHLTELFKEFKTKSGRYLDFIQDSFFENFKILRDFGDKNTMEIAQFDTIYDNDRSQGVPFDQLDPTSSIVSRLALFMNYGYIGQGSRVKANTSHAWVMMPTPADRSGTTIFKLKTLDKQDYSFMGLFDQGSEFKEWVTGVIKGEFERIKKVRAQFDKITDKDKLIENFHYVGNELGNGGYFNYYPELNQFLVTDEIGDLKDIDFDSSEVQSVIQQAVTEQIQADLNYLEDIGVIEPLVINAKGDKTYYEFRPSKHVKSVLPSSTISDGNIMSFIVHSIIANHELSALFNGDLAYFKSGKREDGTRGAILENANKRAGLSSTPGRKLRIGEGAAAPEFRVAFMKDETVPSDLLSVFHNFLPSKQANKYKKTESTDGQGFVSLDRYADILSGQGLLTPSMAQTIAELKKDPKDINWNNVTETLQPVKGFLHGQRFDSEFGAMVPRVLKYSLLPIFPASIVDNPTMQNIYSRMQKNNIDETVFNTAAKYGATNLNSIKDEGDLDFVTLSNEDWRIPQVVPYKTKTMENFGSQTRKLIMGNIKPETDYGGYTGEQLRARYQAAISQKLANSFKDALTSISTNGKMDIAKVARKVLDDLSKNVFKSNSDFINKALEVVTLENGEIDTRIPMSFPAIKHKVESSLNSMIRKAVTKQDLPGFNAVVYSSIGYNKEGIKVSKNLKMARPSKDGKTILPAEIIASPQYFIQSLYKKLNKIEDKTSPDAQAIMEIISKLKQGTLDINFIPESLRQTVIYRIPTQGKNSMLPGIIVGFSPEVLGSVVTLPAEVVTQSGMDYDIDKVYLELKHFEMNNGKFEEFSGEVNSPQGLDNTIVESHYAVLTSPKHYEELITPNNTDTLETLMKEIVPVYEGETAGRKWSSLATQDDFREKNQAGGVFIGIASIANTAHAVFQELGVTINSENKEVKQSVNNAAFSGYVTQDMIGQNDVMVFGSNEGGFHGQGMAALAYANTTENYRKWNPNLSNDVKTNKVGDFAIAGQIGLMQGNKGMGYGLNTVKRPGVPLSSSQVEANIKALYINANKNPDKRYIIPYNSDGNLNQKSLKELAKLFNDAGPIPTNVVFGDRMQLALSNLRGNTVTFTQIDSEKSNESITKVNIYAGTNENSELSNFAFRPFEMPDPNNQAQNAPFDSVEQYFQWRKAVFAGDNSTASDIYNAKNASTAKSLGKKVKGLNAKEWDKVSYSIMKEAVLESFKQNPDALKTLIDTGNSILTHTQDRTKWGKNFPEILMSVREELGVTINSGNSEVTNTVPDFKFKGGYANVGKGTPQGDGKDKAMREIADGFIGEISYFFDDNTISKSSSHTSYNTIYNKSKYSNTGASNTSVFTAVNDSPEIVMLARNSERSGKVLEKLTKEQILKWSNNGAKFVVGDMPGVDSQFVDYLTEIGADFTIYHTGNTPRIGKKESLNFTQTGEGLKINGESVKSLSQVTNRDGDLISDDHIEIQTAAVDNASNPILGNLNINTITGSTYLFLVEAGLGLKYPTMLVNSPIIRELTRRTRMNEAIMGTEGAFQSALTELAKDRSIDISSVNDMDFDVSLSALEGSLAQYKEGSNFTSYDNDILLAFLTFRKYGNDMHTVQAALQIDNIGARQTLAANIIQQDKMAQVVGTYTNAEFSKTQSVEDLNLIETIKLDREKYKNHSMEAYERFGLQGAIQIVGEVIEDATPVFRKVLRDFQTGIGGVLVESDVRMLMNDFYTYLFANQGATEAGSVTSPLANLEGRDVARLLMGNDSVGKRVLVTQRADLAEAKNDIRHTPNQFLQSLSVDTAHSSGYDVVAFNNTITKALTSDQKTMLTNEFLDMFNSENEYIQELAQDLFLYNFYTEGFSRGVNSFSEFVPAEIYEIMTGDQGQNLVDYFRDIRDSFNTASKFDTGTFLMRFLQNRGEGLKGIKDLRKMNPSQIRNFLASNQRVRYFLMRTGKGTVIGKRTGKASFVGIATPIGVKNIHVEYQSGNFISELTTSEDVLKKALYSEDVIETENSSCIF